MAAAAGTGGGGPAGSDYEPIMFHNAEPRTREERLAAQNREKLEKNLLKVREWQHRPLALTHPKQHKRDEINIKGESFGGDFWRLGDYAGRFRGHARAASCACCWCMLHTQRRLHSAHTRTAAHATTTSTAITRSVRCARRTAAHVCACIRHCKKARHDCPPTPPPPRTQRMRTLLTRRRSCPLPSSPSPTSPLPLPSS